jgi:thiol-disulfide isomerase/thioredoxin
VSRLSRLARCGAPAARRSGRPGSGARADSDRSRGPRAGQKRARMRRAVTAVPVLTVVALTAAACDGGTLGQDTPLSSGQNFVGSPYQTTVFKTGSRPAAPAVSGPTLAGASLSLSAYRGDVVVVNFWGSWCAPCRAEAPTLGTLARRLAGQGVRFVGIDIRDETDAALGFMQDFNVSYPSISDPSGDIALLFHSTVPPTAIPSTVVIDRRGRIAASIVGGVSYKSLKALLISVAGERG